MIKTGHRVCRKIASQLREEIGEQLALHGHLDPEFVKRCLRPTAKDDAELHRAWDPRFTLGYGPAVERQK